MENVIRNRRKELGLSQEELAKKCGVSRQTEMCIRDSFPSGGTTPGMWMKTGAITPKAYTETSERFDFFTLMTARST